MTSIIIPAHNEKKNLETLLPLLDTLRKGHESEVLISLSSTTNDGSKSLLEAYNVRSVVCDTKGRAAQMNTASRMSKQDILVFLHADVIPPKNFIQDIENTIDSGYDAGFFSYRFDKKSIFLQINAYFTAKDGIFTGGGDQCLFIKKEAFETLGGFDERQVLMEDFEFFKRMKNKGLRYTIVKNDLIVSARKYKDNSYLKINLTNFLLVVLFKCGYPPNKLKSLHDRLITMPYKHKQ